MINPRRSSACLQSRSCSTLFSSKMIIIPSTKMCSRLAGSKSSKQQAATAATLDRYCRSASCLSRVLQAKLLISWLYTRERKIEREREREISSFDIPKSAPKLSMVFVGSITTVSLFHAEPGCVLVLLLLLWHDREGERERDEKRGLRERERAAAGR